MKFSVVCSSLGIILFVCLTRIVRSDEKIKRAFDDVQGDVETEIDPKRVNLAEFYSEDYPVIFNISLFIMVFMGIAVLAVSIWMWHMDPGKESIIYRMTMTRAKRD